MKKINLLIFTVLTFVFSTVAVFAQGAGIKINKIEDSKNKRLTVSGKTENGAESGISVHIKDKNGETVYYDAVKSRENGEFSFGIDAAYLTDGEYIGEVSDGNNSVNFDFSLPFDASAETPISAKVSDGTVLVGSDGTIDAEFARAYVDLKNLKVSKGRINKNDYEVYGLPEGCAVNVTAVSEERLALDFSGKIGDNAEDKDISVLLKSSIIFSGSANTDSAEIKGIKIYNLEKSTRVWFGDLGALSVQMKNETQSPSGTAELQLLFRKMNVDKVLEYGKDYTFSKEKLPEGINMVLTANKAEGKILISFTGSAKQSVTAPISIDDLVIKSNCAVGAVSDSRPITVTITAKKSDSQQGGGKSDSGNSSGGNSSGKNNTAVSAPNTWNGTHTVDTKKQSYFNDIVSHWAENAINKLAAAGIINGYEDNSFKPDNSITRAEFVTMTVKALNIKAENEYSGAFKDVYSDSWFAEQVQCGLDSGFISQDENFRPNDNIKRSEAMKILIGAYLTNHDKADVIIDSDSFADSPEIQEWSREYINQGLSLGIIKGYEDATFKPGKNLTRAEAATMLSKIKDLL